jgi:hypothetical protein
MLRTFPARDNATEASRRLMADMADAMAEAFERPGGREPDLTADEIKRGRELFRDELRKNQLIRKWRRKDQAALVRTLLARDGLALDATVKDRIVVEQIIRPVLKPVSK